MDQGGGGGGRDGSGGDADDVLERSEGDVGYGMARIEVQEVGFELLVGWVGVEEVGVEDD